MIKEAFNATEIFPTEQKVKLSENSASWPEAINSILMRKYPEISNYIDKITFTHLDKLKGTAIGYITMMDNIFRIPFVINKFVLNPLDVYIKGTKYGYLCRETAKRLTSSSWPFKQVNKSDFTGLKKLAAVNMTDITDEELSNNTELMKIAMELGESHPEVILELLNNVHNVGILKQANFDPYGIEKIASLEVDNTKTNIILHHFGKQDEVMTLTQAASRFGMDKVAELLENGSSYTVLRDVMCKVAEDLPKAQFGTDTSLPRTVNLADGLGGFVRGNIYELRDVLHPNNKKGHIFLSTRSKDSVYTTIFNSIAKDRIYSLSERAPLSDIVDDLNRPSGSKGQALGILLNNVIYGPFEVFAEAHIEGEHVLSIKDGYEYESKRIHVTNKVKTIIVDDEEIYVPSFAKIMWLGEPYQMESPLNKVAAVNVTVASTPDRLSFNIYDNGVSGLDGNGLQNLKKTKAVSALMHCGLSKEEALSAVETARTSGTYKFKATSTATQSEDQTRKEVDDATKTKLTKVAENIRSIVDKSNLIKMASIYGNDESVDTALGLKLITPTSVKKYRLLIPKIEDNIDGLTKLLMAKRVGGESIPLNEENLSNTIAALSDIGYELTGI